ncbi:unnamed protein product, partial [Allacma fusca]
MDPRPGPMRNAQVNQNVSNCEFEMDDLTEDEDLEERQANSGKLSNYCKSEESPLEKSKKIGFVREYEGIILTLLAGLIFSCDSYASDTIRRQVFGPGSYSLLKYMGITISSIVILICLELSPCRNESRVGKGTKSVFDAVWPIRKNWKNLLGLVGKSLLVAASDILRIFILRYWTIADSYVIYHSSPVFVTVMAHFLLGEKIGLISVSSALLTLVGVVAIAEPPLLFGGERFDSFTLTGAAFAVGILLCDTSIVIVTRSMREVNFALMLLVYGVLGMVQSLVISKVLFGLPLPIITFQIFLISLYVAGGAFLGEMLVILGLKFEKAGTVSSVRASEISFSIFLAFLIHGVRPDNWSIIGCS